jgi:hypothetical protein
MGTQLLAETLLPHSLSYDCYIKQKHKSDYYQVATIASFFWPKLIKCTKIVGGWGSAPDPAEGAHDAPTDPLVGWGGLFPRPQTQSAPLFSRLTSAHKANS